MHYLAKIFIPSLITLFNDAGILVRPISQILFSQFLYCYLRFTIERIIPDNGHHQLDINCISSSNHVCYSGPLMIWNWRCLSIIGSVGGARGS